MSAALFFWRFFVAWDFGFAGFDIAELANGGSLAFYGGFALFQVVMGILMFCWQPGISD